MDKRRLLLIVSVTTLIISGCAALLPRASFVAKSPWKSYDAVINSYEKIVPDRTTVQEMKKLGFDIYSTPNLKILSYVDIAVASQAMKKEDTSSGIVACLKAQNQCNGYVFEPQVVKSKRYGNFWLDIFYFKRSTLETGWKFKASFLVINNIVVEKYWSGEPKINQDKEVVNPLGPIQEFGGILMRSQYNPW